MRHLLAGFVLSLGLAACDSVPTFPVGGSPAPLLGWSGDNQVAVHFSDFEARERIVVRDAAQWAALWPKLRLPGDVPAVDFATNIVIVASMGTASSGGYLISFPRATMVGATLWVEVRETTPGPACITTQAITQPTVIAVVPRIPDSVAFFERAEVNSCEG